MSLREFVTRREAHEHLKSRGLNCAIATLAKLACVGGGPPITYFGASRRPKPLYRLSDLDAWAECRLHRAISTSGRPMHSCPIAVKHAGSEAGAGEQAAS